MTKGELFTAMSGLPDDTELEICAPTESGTADYTVDAEKSGIVTGSHNPLEFVLVTGEFKCDCG